MKFDGVVWLAAGKIGIVRLKTELGETVYRVGLTVPGFTPDEDISNIIDWGSFVNAQEMRRFFFKTNEDSG